MLNIKNKHKMKKYLIKALLIFLSPLTIVSTFYLKIIANIKTKNISDKIFMSIGLLPILDQYYQPLINPRKHLKKSLRIERNLAGIDFNIEEQLKIISQFNYNEELLKFPLFKTDNIEYYYNNNSYMSGDSEYLYNIIRLFKPKRIIEIGSGYSTLMASNAIRQNISQNKNYNCDHICIEPYEQDWLKKTGVTLIRERVEDIEVNFFKQLQRNDILFIDSSHIIRPQGDVLFEYSQILPILNSGVIIHIHDIFSPRDYLDKWIYDDHLMWNEQYLLEAFLCFNNEFKIIGAVNYLSNNYNAKFCGIAPIYASQINREPGAFWIQKK
jgi:predicted O-methyltransferase YrrM